MERGTERSGLFDVYKKLLKEYGPQDWWPAETAFEVIIGAILTQNTAWTNVEKAIVNLKDREILNPASMYSTPVEIIAEAIRPSGYYNRKAGRIKSFMFFFSEGYKLDINRMAKQETCMIRKELLEVKGIGEETADSIILYALEKATFVIDAYTKRIFSRLGLFDGNEKYGEMKAVFEQQLKPDTSLFNEYHALIVKHAKMYCSVKPGCTGCPINEGCQYYTEKND